MNKAVAMSPKSRVSSIIKQPTNQPPPSLAQSSPDINANKRKYRNAVSPPTDSRFTQDPYRPFSTAAISKLPPSRPRESYTTGDSRNPMFMQNLYSSFNQSEMYTDG